MAHGPIRQEYAYDLDKNLTGLTVRSGEALLSHASYAYDGNGNRIASTLFGHETVYLVVGSIKLAAVYESALWRARNIAAPKNAQRLNRKTPCAVKGDRCYDCGSPDRICRALVVLWGKPNTVKKMEILLVDEALGY